jgi:hypothetical protein
MTEVIAGGECATVRRAVNRQNLENLADVARRVAGPHRWRRLDGRARARGAARPGVRQLAAMLMAALLACEGAWAAGGAAARGRATECRMTCCTPATGMGGMTARHAAMAPPAQAAPPAPAAQASRAARVSRPAAPRAASSPACALPARPAKAGRPTSCSCGSGSGGGNGAKAGASDARPSLLAGPPRLPAPRSARLAGPQAGSPAPLPFLAQPKPPPRIA